MAPQPGIMALMALAGGFYSQHVCYGNIVGLGNQIWVY